MYNKVVKKSRFFFVFLPANEGHLLLVLGVLDADEAVNEAVHAPVKLRHVRVDAPGHLPVGGNGHFHCPFTVPPGSCCRFGGAKALRGGSIRVDEQRGEVLQGAAETLALVRLQRLQNEP